MININNYIVEKLHLNKDTKYINKSENLVSDIKAYYLDKWGIKFETWDAKINIASSNKYIIITLTHHHNSYKQMMNDINTKFENKLEKPCKSNNQSIYVYPKL